MTFEQICSCKLFFIIRNFLLLKFLGWALDFSGVDTDHLALPLPTLMSVSHTCKNISETEVSVIFTRTLTKMIRANNTKKSLRIH